MGEYRRGAHTVYEIHLHLVWTTKYRKAVLVGEAAMRVRDLIREIGGIHDAKIMLEFPHIKKHYWGQHMWARGYFRCSRGNVTDEIIAEYIAHHQEDRDADLVGTRTYSPLQEPRPSKRWALTWNLHASVTGR